MTHPALPGSLACLALLLLPRVGGAQVLDTLPPVDWAAVAGALGNSGTLQPGGVYRVGMPRGDLRVTVGGVVIRPALALGSWVGFKQTGPNAVVAMGDLVLLDSEVVAVARNLQDGGVEITAVHNHLLHDSPHVLYMHFQGAGDPLKIAVALHAAVALTGTPPGAQAAVPESLELDTAGINQVLGRAGKVNAGVYQVGVPRAERITEDGIELPPALGVATAINFQPTGGRRAAITGDFVLLGSEVQPVIRALQQAGIEVTALHSHMLDESPRLYFMHFWAHDDALALARGLRAALDRTNVQPPK